MGANTRENGIPALVSGFAEADVHADAGFQVNKGPDPE
jgi:hypothetical protein